MCLSLARALDPHVFVFAGGVVLGSSSGSAGSSDTDGSGDSAAWFLKRVEARYRALDWRVGDAEPSEGATSGDEGGRRDPRGPLFLSAGLAGAAALRGAVELACASASPT